jgi:hypothetical protein
MPTRCEYRYSTDMNEFSVRKLSKVVYGDEGVVSKYRMLRPHSGTDRPFNLFAGAHKSHTSWMAASHKCRPLINNGRAPRSAIRCRRLHT